MKMQNKLEHLYLVGLPSLF